MVRFVSRPVGTVQREGIGSAGVLRAASRDGDLFAGLEWFRALAGLPDSNRKGSSIVILSADPGLVEDGSVLNLTMNYFTYGLGLRSPSRFFFSLPVFGDEYYSRSILTYEGPAIITFPAMIDRLALRSHLGADYRPLRIRTCVNIEIWMRANS